MTQQPSLPALDELARSARGPLHVARTPGHAVFAASDAYDVACAMRLAASAGLRVAVQQATPLEEPHDLLLLLDLADLAECDVHPAGWARVGAGVTWAALLSAAAPLGLTPPQPGRPEALVVHDVTRAGPLVRGVRAVDLVTGTGRLLRATPTDAVELFDGLREGREVIGIVTAIELDLVGSGERGDPV